MTEQQLRHTEYCYTLHLKLPENEYFYFSSLKNAEKIIQDFIIQYYNQNGVKQKLNDSRTMPNVS